jgi:hypothetical protein
MLSVPQALTPTEDWKLTASHSVATRIGGTASPRSAFNFEGWSTGETQKKGMWFQIEFPDPQVITEIHFNSPPKRRGSWRDNIPPFETFPRGYEVQVSADGTNWNSVSTGEGGHQEVAISFDPVSARFLRITQTAALEEEGEIPWSMRQMKIYGMLHPKKDIN